MEKTGFRLRLNLFDAIVLILAVAAGAFLLWNKLQPEPAQESPAATSGIRYVVRFSRWPQGTSSLVQPGDTLEDAVKNYALGTVAETQVVPSETLLLNEISHAYELVTIEGYEDILVTVESPATITEKAVTLSGGYELRVNTTMYIEGAGYMASGPVVSVEREGTA